ncbi:uncharacterized protein [Nicotiana sylvestris]|uniref:uncharacterized protein n=1 Tax=Nicotiana sylvestris TaxID=4096 RepID=UPI00388CD260
MAINMNVQELLVIGDSDLLIHQDRGEWETKNSKILPYLHHIQKLRKRFTKTEFQHVPRVQNEFADALATLSSMIQHPDTNFIDPIPVKIHDQPTYCAHVEEEADGKPWFHDIKDAYQIAIDNARPDVSTPSYSSSQSSKTTVGVRALTA